MKKKYKKMYKTSDFEEDFAIKTWDKKDSVVTHVSDESDPLDVFMFSVHLRRPLRVAMKDSVTWNLWKRPCL